MMELDQAVRYLQGRMVSNGIKSTSEKIKELSLYFEIKDMDVMSTEWNKVRKELKRQGFTLLPRLGKHNSRLIAIKKK